MGSRRFHVLVLLGKFVFLQFSLHNTVLNNMFKRIIVSDSTLNNDVLSKKANTESQLGELTGMRDNVEHFSENQTLSLLPTKLAIKNFSVSCWSMSLRSFLMASTALFLTNVSSTDLLILRRMDNSSWQWSGPPTRGRNSSSSSTRPYRTSSSRISNWESMNSRSSSTVRLGPNTLARVGIFFIVNSFNWNEIQF